MIQLTERDRLQPHTTIATIGMFDGFHEGHRQILDNLSKRAAFNNISPLVVTFNQHPQIVFGDPDFRTILTTPQRFELFEQALGTNDYLLALDFTPELAAHTAREFITMLRDRYGVGVLQMGFNQHFGSDGRGLDYQELGEQLGVRVCLEKECTPFFNRNVPHVSSSVIRDFIRKGEIEQANSLLLFDYAIEGIVTHGNGNGRKLGFPTANVDRLDPHQILPPYGAYCVRVFIEDSPRSGVFGPVEECGMANIGLRPTIGDIDRPALEVHLLDFDDDIYGRRICVMFDHFIRPEKKLDSLDGLKAQLAEDAEYTRKHFKSQYT